MLKRTISDSEKEEIEREIKKRKQQGEPREMAKATVKPPDPLFEADDEAEMWKKWRRRWEIYERVTATSKKDDRTRCDVFLSYVGDYGLDIIESLELGDKETLSYATVLSALDGYFNPKISKVSERYNLLHAKQAPGTPFAAFNLELRKMAGACGFTNKEQEKDFMLMALISGIRDDELRRRLLMDSKMTLDKAVTECRTWDLARKSNKTFTAATDDPPSSLPQAAFKVKTEPGCDTVEGAASVSAVGPRFKGDSSSQCPNCGLKHAARCPARGQKCNACGRMGHYARCCRSRSSTSEYHQGRTAKVRNIQPIKEDAVEDPEVSGSSDGLLYCDAIVTEQYSNISHQKILELNACRPCAWIVDIIANSRFSFPAKVDTGAACSVMAQSLLEKIGPVRLQTSEFDYVKSYSKNLLRVTGSVDLECKVGDSVQKITFHIVSGPYDTLLGLGDSELLGLVRRDSSRVRVVTNARPSVTVHELEQWSTKFPELFRGVGCLRDMEHTIQLKSGYVPVVRPPRRVPAAVRAELKQELADLVAQHIIRRIDEPTEFASNIVVVRQKGKLRICLDPADLNPWIQRAVHPLPNVDDLRVLLAGARLYSKLDLRKGFWQIPLAPSSQPLTTFNTPWGRYCFERLPFGIKSAPEIFQRAIQDVLAECEGVIAYMDDILIHGPSKNEHDKRLVRVLSVLEKNGLTLNEAKCSFGITEVDFVGHRLSKDGAMAMTACRVQAINDFRCPENVEQLRRFLGMVGYVRQYVPSFAQLALPLQSLLRKDTDWSWGSAQEHAFKELKQMLMRAPVLVAFNPSVPCVLQVDASHSALGASLIQQGRPVAFASKSLTPAQTCYSQLEKEALAILFGCQRFHFYVMGTDLTIETDHRPLEMIARKPLSMAPARLQSMFLKIQTYSPCIQYRPGKELHLADCLSRDAPTTTDRPLVTEDIVICALQPVRPGAMMIYQEATAWDAGLTAVGQMASTDWPESAAQCPGVARQYWDVRDEISKSDGLIYRGERLVVPPTLRREVYLKAHLGHLGMTSTLSLMHSSVYWPGMTADVKRLISECDICQQHRDAQPREEMRDIPRGTYPWQRISADLAEIDGRHFLVVVDSATGLLEVDELESKSAVAVVRRFRAMFQRYGIPEEVRADNNPFLSQSMSKMAEVWGFKISTCAPEYHQGNGRAERGVHSFKTVYRKCQADGSDWRLGVLGLRLSTRMGCPSPAEMFFGRALNGPLPRVVQKQERAAVRLVGELSDRRHEAEKGRYDRGTRAIENMESGQAVWIRMGRYWRKGRIEASCNPERSYKVRLEDGAIYRRHVSLVRPRLECSAIPLEDRDEKDVPSESETSERVTEDTVQEKTGRGCRKKIPRRWFAVEGH